MVRRNYWDGLQRRLTRRRLLAAAATLTGSLAAGAACGGAINAPLNATPHPGPPQAGGALRLALFFDPDDLDPATGGFAFPVFQRVYSFLFHLHGKTFEYMPDLAIDFEQPDEVTYIFGLRRGVNFHDLQPVSGRELTAQDVLYTLDRLKLAFNSIDPGFMWRIAKSVEAPNDHMVKITTQKPYASALQILGGFWYAIVPHELAEMYRGLSKNAIGSGPFILERFEQESGAALRRNPDYYGAPEPYLDALEIGVVGDYTNLLTQFRTKNLDVNTAPLDSPRWEALRRELNGVQSSKNPGILAPWIGMNINRPPLNDPRVRRAIDIGIDRRQMIDVLAFGDGKLNGPIPWGNEIWALPQEELEAFYVHDPVEARRLLEEAGVDDVKLKHVVTTALPLGREIGAIIKEQLRPLGIDITIEVLEQNAFIERVFLQRRFDTCGFDWFPVLDPTVSLRFVDSGDIFGRIFGFFDPEVGRLYDRMQSTFDLEQRIAVVHELQRAVLKLHGPVLYL
ncbi:MAG: ABC transporter substrate-binding protein, partial [Vicinamibacterales bacterium]